MSTPSKKRPAPSISPEKSPRHHVRDTVSKQAKAYELEQDLIKVNKMLASQVKERQQELESLAKQIDTYKKEIEVLEQKKKLLE